LGGVAQKKSVLGNWHRRDLLRMKENRSWSAGERKWTQSFTKKGEESEGDRRVQKNVKCWNKGKKVVKRKAWGGKQGDMGRVDHH